MLFSNAKKIVVIKDIPSNIIEEAIFILKNDPGNTMEGERNKGPAIARNATGKDYLLKEAESVINSYILQNKYSEHRTSGISLKLSSRKKLITNLVINASMLGSIALLIIVISRFF